MCVGSWILDLGSFVLAYVHTYMHTYMHLGSWIFCVGSYQSQGCRYICCKYWIFSSTHVGSYQSHCIGIGSFIDVAIWLKTNLRIDGIVFFF